MFLNAIAEKLKRQSKDDFKGRHFEAWLIVGTDGTKMVPSAIKTSVDSGFLQPKPVPYVTKHLQQRIESDHFRTKKNMPKVGGFQSFITARRTIAGFEAMLWLNDLLARLFGLQILKSLKICNRPSKRAIAGGRRLLRHVMFQAVLVASYHSTALRVFADRLRDTGKPHKVVITAVARKLVTIANALCNARQNWAAQPA